MDGVVYNTRLWMDGSFFVVFKDVDGVDRWMRGDEVYLGNIVD
jgi:hypothetical protein